MKDTLEVSDKLNEVRAAIEEEAGAHREPGLGKPRDLRAGTARLQKQGDACR